jgi:hypothetical protein
LQPAIHSKASSGRGWFTRFANGRNCLNAVRSVFGFVIFVVLVDYSISATVGVSSLLAGGFATNDNLARSGLPGG